MSACTPPPLPLHGRLAEIAEILDEAHAASPDPLASIVRLAARPDDEVELAVSPLDPADVLGSLLGLVTPPEWDAVGVVVDGTQRHWDVGSGVAGAAEGRVRVVLLCARDGASAAVLRRPGEQPRRVVTPSGGEAPVGRIADALRRSLGLHTAPPRSPVGVVVAQVWLHRVHTLALQGEPVDRALTDVLRPPAPAGWTALREQRGEGAWEELDCSPQLAAWMDDGMFSRWCLAGFPEPLEVLVELSELLEPEVADHLVGELATASVRP